MANTSDFFDLPAPFVFSVIPKHIEFSYYLRKSKRTVSQIGSTTPNADGDEIMYVQL